MDSLKLTYIHNIPETLLASLKPLSLHALDVQHDLDDLPSESEGSEDERDSHTVEGITKSIEDIELPTPAAGSPILWFTSHLAPAKTKLGIYKSMLPSHETPIQSIQINGTSRLIAMFMAGGGHFSGVIIDLNGSDCSRCNIVASRGFHRYTTRRKQGGSQSANDNAKGAANSAGAQIRRYNEIALQEDVRALLTEWKHFLDKVDIILIRASGQSSRKLLYDNGLQKGDPRIRGFPLNTRRATQSEIVRSFHILTRLQVSPITEEDLAVKVIKKETPTISLPVEVIADPLLVAQTTELVALVKRNKGLPLTTYIAEHQIDVNQFLLEPQKSFIHAPSLLHYAASIEANTGISALLDLDASPTLTNAEGKTAFEVSGGKSTRECFRIWRGLPGNEQKHDWAAARIPSGLSASQLASRQAKVEEERAQQEAAEALRRSKEAERLEDEAQLRREEEAKALERKRGPARLLPTTLGNSSTSLAGLTPAMKTKIERERRARAAEARFAKK